jgi:uncharacterized Zn-binding protein involved in type VI secretion
VFKIPNYSDAAFPDQAEPDSVDFDALTAGFAVYGVKTGCAVSAQGTPDMTVAVAVGTVYVGGRPIAVTAGNVTITTADPTNARFDLITVDVNGSKAAVAGSAASNPVFPAIPAARVVLAAVYLPAGDTAINSNQIIDKRVLLNPFTSGWYNVRDYGATGDGTTDDATAMQACLTACRLAGGGTVYYPPGTYLIGSQQGNQQYVSIPRPGVSIGTKTKVLGAGPGNTIIKLKGGLASGFEMIMNWNNDSDVDRDIIVQDLSVDGNKAGVTHSDEYGAAVALRKTKQCKYINVHAHDTWVRGLVFEAGSYNSMRGCCSYDNREFSFILSNEGLSYYVDCIGWGEPSAGANFSIFEIGYQAARCGAVACRSFLPALVGRHVHLKGSGGSGVTDALVEACIFQGGESGILVEYASRPVIVGNEFIATAGWPIDVADAVSPGGLVEGNTAVSCWPGLIRNQSADWNIGGNRIDGCGIDNESYRLGLIRLQGSGALRTLVHNNTIRGGVQGYSDGVKETTGADYNRIEHNDIYGLQAGYSAVTLLGANSTKHRNRGSELVTRRIQVRAEDLKAMAGAASSAIGSGVSAIATRAYGASALEEANLEFLLPSTYVQNLNCYIEWAPVDAGTGNVRWALDYKSIAIGGDVGATSTEVPLDVAAPAVASARTRTTLATALTVTAGQLVKFAIARYGAHANDTYAGIAHLLMVEFTWEELED